MNTETFTAPTLAETYANVPTVSQAIVNYVQKAGSSTFAELFEIFGPDNVCPQTARKSFIAQLRYLTSRHELALHGRQAKGYSFDSLVITPPGVTPPEVTAPARHPLRATPPQNDVLHAPVWVPPACSVLRPGALAHQKHASFGVRC